MKLPTCLVLTAALAGCGSSNNSDVDAGMLGPGATLKCDSSNKDAWDTYGADGFVAVNKAIFANVNAELTGANGTSNLGSSFSQIGMGSHDALDVFEGQLAAFLVFAYGGPSSITYTHGVPHHANADMVTAHKGLGITASQYDYFIASIVVPALTASGVKHGAGGSADPDDV